MRKAIAAAMVLSLAVAATVKADRVVTNEGDIINGTVTSIDGGNLVLQSDTLTKVTVPMAHVRTFSTDAPIDIILTDGTEIKSKVGQSDPGDVVLAGDSVMAAQKVPVSAIDQVNPQIWTGDVKLGGTLVRGNAYTDTLNAAADFAVKVRDNQFIFTGEYDYGKTKDRTTGVSNTTVDQWMIDAQFNHYFSKKFFGYLDAAVAKNRVASLDLRFTPSAGLGYQWFDKAPFKFNTEGGIAWLYEQYTNATPRREEVALKLAYHLTYDINTNVSLFNDVTYVPSIERGSNYVISADAGVHAKLTTKLFLEFKAEWDYDSNPAIGALKNDTQFIASVGYSL